MMQKHRILMSSTGSTGSTTTVDSSMQVVNGYEINNIQGLGGGIVNYSNIRGFLNDSSNDIIINDFFSYLTGSTTTVEFAEIYNSDQKLADVFNNYYQSSVVNNQLPPTSVIDESLSNTSGFTVVNNLIYNLDGVAPSKGLDSIPLSINNSTRQLKVFSALTTFTYEPSYYIPVFVKRNHSQTDRERIYIENIMQQINDFVPDGGGGGTGDGSDYGDYGNDYNTDNDYNTGY